MATNGAISTEDTDMAECDGEKVVTMMDVLQEQQDFEDDANAVLGASDEKNCTYSKGYIKRQAIYACLTCCAEAKDDPTKRAGVCLACSLNCHENHELIELYTKRNFRCDCGNPKFKSNSCHFTPNKPDLNEDNHYNQNFSGLYCNCHRPYPDPEATFEDEMIQCIICEDWLHSSHLDAVVPNCDQDCEMICKDCMEKNEFLHDYSGLAISAETVDIDILTVNGSDPQLNNDDLVLVNGKQDLPAFDMEQPNSIFKSTEENMDVNSAEMKPIEVNDVKSLENETVIDPQIAANIENNDSMETDSENQERNFITELSVETNVDKQSEFKDEELNVETSEHTEDKNIAQHTESKEEVMKIETTQPTVETNIDKNTKSQDESKLETIESTVETNMDKQKESSNGSNMVRAVKTTEESKSENTDECNQEAMDVAAGNEESLIEESNAKGDLESEKSKDATKYSKIDASTTSQDDTKMEESSNISDNLNSKSAGPIHTDLCENKYSEDLCENKIVENISDVTENVDSTVSAEESIAIEVPTDIEGNDQNILNKSHSLETEPTAGAGAKSEDDEANYSKDTSCDKDSHMDCRVKNIDTVTNKDNINSDSTNNADEHDENSLIDTGNEISEISLKNNGNLEPKSPREVDNADEHDENSSIDTGHEISEISPKSNDNLEPKSPREVDNEDQKVNSTEEIKENKRKLSMDEPIEKSIAKKAKLEDKKCTRPCSVKNIYRGATFWPSHFRQKLCTCNECLTMYKDLSVLFLIDSGDTVTAYERLGKERIDGQPATQYEKGLQALSSLDRIQQINALTEYNKMRDKLLDFLKSFKDRKEVVKEEDIKGFFAGMKPKREPDGVYFCR